MSWKISLLALICGCVTSCKLDGTSVDVNASESGRYFNVDYLVEAETLIELQSDPSIKVIDFRKKESYDQGHISGAITMWRDAIEDTANPVGGIMASRAHMELVFSKLGIQNSDTVVVYDDRGSCDAARLWWVLANYDFHNVQILNGGLDAWKVAGGAVNKETPQIKESNFSLPENNTMHYIAIKEEVLPTEVAEKGAVVIDARTWDEFTGKRQKKGAQSGGRIPGSIWLDWVDAMDFEKTKKFKTAAELELLYRDLEKDQPIIVYCHSGVRSAHTTFVLTQLLGYQNIRNYDGSWTEWSSISGYPIEKDSVTTLFK